MCHRVVCPFKFMNYALLIPHVINRADYLPLPLHHVTLALGGGRIIPLDPLLIPNARLLFCFVWNWFLFFIIISFLCFPLLKFYFCYCCVGRKQRDGHVWKIGTQHLKETERKKQLIFTWKQMWVVESIGSFFFLFILVGCWCMKMYVVELAHSGFGRHVKDDTYGTCRV